MTLTRTLTRLIDLLYVKPLRRIVPPQTFRYAACGGLNMALDLSLYFLLYNFVLDKRVVHIDGIVAISPYITAFLIVFPITFLTGFWMNRHIAFHSSPLRGRVQLFRYLLSVCGSILPEAVRRGLRLLSDAVESSHDGRYNRVQLCDAEILLVPGMYGPVADTDRCPEREAWRSCVRFSADRSGFRDVPV